MKKKAENYAGVLNSYHSRSSVNNFNESNIKKMHLLSTVPFEVMYIDQCIELLRKVLLTTNSQCSYHLSIQISRTFKYTLALIQKKVSSLGNDS